MRISRLRGSSIPLLLSLWLTAFVTPGNAAAQTITTDKTELLAGERARIEWSYTKTRPLDDMGWELCVKAVTSRQLDNLETAGLDGYCIEQGYSDAKDGSGEYYFHPYLPVGVEYQHYIAAVVNKRDNYKPYAHVAVTVSHPEYPYDDNLIKLPEGHLFGSGEPIPIEIGDAGPPAYEDPTRDIDQIRIYRRPVRNIDGSVRPGRYVGSIEARPGSAVIEPETYMWDSKSGVWRGDILGQYELHYVRDGFVIARAAFENGIPDLQSPLRILSWDSGGISARLDRREIQRLGSRAGISLILYRLNERSRTPLANIFADTEPRPGFAEDFTAEDCDDMPEACFADKRLSYTIEAGEYQVQLVAGGLVIASEQLSVTKEELAARTPKVPEITAYNSPVALVAVGPPTTSGSVISLRAFVPRYMEEEGTDWFLTIDTWTDDYYSTADIDRITLWELAPGTPLEREIMLAAGKYVARIERIAKAEDDNPERKTLVSPEFTVDMVLPQGSVLMELDTSRTYVAGAEVKTKVRLADGIADRIDGRRIMAVLENTALTTPACYRNEYSGNFRRTNNDLGIDLYSLPMEPGTYALRLYYPARGQDSGGLRLVTEQLIKIALPDARIRLLESEALTVGEAPRATVDGADMLLGEKPAYYKIEFEGAGWVVPGGGQGYESIGLGGSGSYLVRSTGRDYADFQAVAAPIVGERAAAPGAYAARLYYLGVLLDSIPFTVADPKDPEYPSMTLASQGRAPSHVAPAARAPSFPAGLPIVCAGFAEPRVVNVEQPDETFPEYKSPPFLGLEAAVYPREPIPGLPVTLGFRIENTSQYPAADIAVTLMLANPSTEHAPRHLVPQTDFCQDQGDGQFRCMLGDMKPGESVDLIFHAETPMTGEVIWTADMDSAGDLGGMVAHGGVLGARAPPRITDVVVIADQKRVEDYGIPSFPYPFGPNSRGRQSRYLLLVGHNLPQRPADNLELPDTETVHYGFLAFPDTNSQFYQEIIANGWQRFYDLDDANEASARAEAEGYDAILVRADLKEGILPGQYTVTASGAEGHWGLEFGDITARLSFVRVLDDGSFDLLTNAYLPERIYLAVQTNMSLPLEGIPVFLNPELLGAGQTQELAMTARRSDTGDGRLYLTGPIDLHSQGRMASLMGGVALPVRLAEDELAVLQARVDEDFVFQSFRIPLDPIVASITVSLSPAVGDYSWLWKDALSRAAACRSDIVVEDWNRLSLAESENIWNLMILTTSDHFPDQSVNFGQHAASILLRDMFLATTEKQLRKLEWIKGNKQAVKGLLAYLKPRASGDGYPLLRMEINDLASGGDIEFRYAIMNETDWLAEQYGTSEAAIEAWQLRETVTALGLLIEKANEALEDARDANDCEVEDLVRMTGFSFDSIGWLLKSQLVTLAETSSPDGQTLLWVPDSTARFWVDQVAPLAAAAKAQQQKSSEDTDLVLTAVAFLTLPFMLSESAVVAIVTFGIDLIDLGVTTVNELSQYFASEAELRFALGASVTIGEERYAGALKNAKGWISTTFGIGSSALGVIAGGFDALPKIAALRRVARGRHVARTLEGVAGVTNLKPVDLQDFGAFAISAQMRSQTSGVTSLSAIERRALDIVDEYGALHQVIRALPEPELPPVKVVDSFEPSAPMRFDPDAQSGFATARPSLEGSIATPRSAGDVPNARDVRVPENGHVRFMTATEIEELPLGDRLGGGYTSEVFAHADDAENLAIRITYLRENAPAAALDQVGDNMLRTRVRSEHVRPVRVDRSYDVVLSDVGQPEITRVMVVERVPETAQQTIARQGGRMSVAQMMAYEGALRDLNRAGLVWLDNKWDNFGFVPLNDGSGRVQVVVMDTGGVVPIRANAGLADGLSAADIARQIQLRVNGDFATQMPEFAKIGRKDFRTAVRRDAIMDDFGETFDYEAMGISGPDQLLFNPKSGEDFDYVAPLFEAVE
ncbi:MAG: hypothetical protein BMS9Abin30_0515 [Gammaproteobacteria bacterium]|nr:MAG: hypothetical protein BMS9Abin30_0515 [Gammaproteobacteria bacterium]